MEYRHYSGNGKLLHRVIEEGQSADRVVTALGVSIRTVGKLIARQPCAA